MLHVLLDLANNLRRFTLVASLKVVALLLVRIRAPEHHNPEALGMSPAHFASDNVVEIDRPRLARVVNHSLRCVARHDVQVVVVQNEHFGV